MSLSTTCTSVESLIFMLLCISTPLITWRQQLLQICYIFLFNLVFFSPFFSETHINYERNALIGIGEGGAGFGLTAQD